MSGRKGGRRLTDWHLDEVSLDLAELVLDVRERHVRVGNVSRLCRSDVVSKRRSRYLGEERTLIPLGDRSLYCSQVWTES